jgi:hypothetical protein
LTHNPIDMTNLEASGERLRTLVEDDLPSDPVPLTAVRAYEHGFAAGLSAFEGDVKAAVVPARLAGVKLITDLFLDHIFHHYHPLGYYPA